MHFKSVLIISDNLSLCKRFSQLLRDLKLKQEYFSFSVSPFSDSILFEKELSLEVLKFNLKHNVDVGKIIENYDLVFSLHCKQLFPDQLIEKIKCINIHPGYNPINRGWYPQVFSIINDVPVGVTIHEIDSKLDNGPIIDRVFVKKYSFDTSLTLYNRLLDAEIVLLEKNLSQILNYNYDTFLPENEGNLYLKKDFKELCRLNLDEKLTLGEAINKLRALSHGSFRNAYFIDPDTNEKVYLSLSLNPDFQQLNK